MEPLETVLLLGILAFFSIQDIRTREIRDELVYAAFLLGVLLNLSEQGLFYSLVVTGVVGGILYITGVFALGDFWVGMIVSAFLPEPFYGVPVGIIALLGGAVLGALYGLVRLVKENPREWMSFWAKTAAVSLAFSYHPLAGIVSAPVLSMSPVLSLAFLPPALAFSGIANILTLAALFLLSGTLIRAVAESGSAFTVEKEPEEGDIPAEVIGRDGKSYPMNLFTVLKIMRGEVEPAHSLGADGLKGEDVERLKGMGIRKIRVKESLPLIPFVTVFLLIYIVSRFLV